MTALDRISNIALFMFQRHSSDYENISIAENGPGKKREAWRPFIKIDTCLYDAWSLFKSNSWSLSYGARLPPVCVTAQTFSVKGKDPYPHRGEFI